jgi:D-threonate/D-erythronate kinase
MALAILADDLTGAADCAARCRGVGLPAEIALRQPKLPFPPGATAFTSDSRHLPPTQAATRVHELVADLRSAADVTWYKKIDSTLRGNLGAELDATIDTLGYDCALVCPAFPAQGRGLSDGKLISSVAQPSDLPVMLAQQSRRPVAAVALTEVRAGLLRLAERFAAARRMGPLLVVDALTDEDLRTILDAAERALPGALLCGSAGLVGALATRYQARIPSDDATADYMPPAGARALLVVGSGSATARRQIAYLRQNQQVDAIEIDPVDDDRRPTTDDRRPTDQETGDERKETGDQATTGNGQQTTDRIRTMHHDDVLLHLPAPAPHSVLDGPGARSLAAALATTALPLIAQLRPALLVLAGGDTAAYVLSALGITRLEVLRELLPGIPLTSGIDAEGRKQLVILKPGNYGDEETLATLLRRVRNEE